jgi:hypothetical protein
LNSSTNAKAVAVAFWMQTLANQTTSSASSSPITDDDECAKENSDEDSGPNKSLISSW